MKTISNLNENDFIAFKWYNRSCEDELVVASVSFINDDNVIVHWLDGFSNESESVKFEDILAIGCNQNGTVKLLGWSGKYIVINETDFLKSKYKLN